MFALCLANLMHAWIAQEISPEPAKTYTMADGKEKKQPVTQEDKARIMSTQAKQHGGQTEKGSFPARIQSAADKNEPPQHGGGKEHSMTQQDKARIMSTQAEKTGGQTEKGSFAARTQSAADKNEPPQQKWLTETGRLSIAL